MYIVSDRFYALSHSGGFDASIRWNEQERGVDPVCNRLGIVVRESFLSFGHEKRAKQKIGMNARDLSGVRPFPHDETSGGARGHGHRSTLSSRVSRLFLFLHSCYPNRFMPFVLSSQALLFPLFPLPQ